MGAHPIGPGPAPSPRDEPVALAIWQALLRVRQASGWLDVARQVEADLRRLGVVGDVHDQLREARREVNDLTVQNNSLRAQWAAREAREARHG